MITAAATNLEQTRPLSDLLCFPKEKPTVIVTDVTIFTLDLFQFFF
jgi:hypothetical protein